MAFNGCPGKGAVFLSGVASGKVFLLQEIIPHSYVARHSKMSESHKEGTRVGTWERKGFRGRRKGTRDRSIG